MFAKLRAKLKAEYKPYTDKGKITAKQRNLQECVTAVMKDLRQTARTREQCINTAKLLYQLADRAVSLAVEITPEQKADKEFVQKVKGTKLLQVSLLSYLGKGATPNSVYLEVEKQAEEEGWSAAQLETAKKQARWKYWGFEGQFESENHYACLAKFAKALCDSLYANEWDGYDVDWEIGSGVFDMDGTLSQNKHLIHLVKEMNNYIGPKSDPEGKGHKMICIDGNIYGLTSELDEYVDYWIIQSYGSSNPGFDGYGVDPKKIICTENFEKYATNGGQLLKQAAAMPQEGYKGGVGAYRFDNDYDNTPNYKWMRQAIQINQRVFNEWKAKQNEAENKPQE